MKFLVVCVFCMVIGWIHPLGLFPALLVGYIVWKEVLNDGK